MRLDWLAAAMAALFALTIIAAAEGVEQRLNNLEWMYAHDKGALKDFVSCDDDCPICRARRYCEELAACELSEPEYLMSEHTGSAPARDDGEAA